MLADNGVIAVPCGQVKASTHCCIEARLTDCDPVGASDGENLLLDEVAADVEFVYLTMLIKLSVAHAFPALDQLSN